MGRWLNLISLVLSVIILLVAVKPDFLLSFSRQKTINSQALTGEYSFFATTASFNSRRIPLPAFKETSEPLYPVLGQTDIFKRIEIDLTNQKLSAYENNNLIYAFPISSGKWHKTPTGTFNIWTKLRYANLEGGSKLLKTYYNLPNVPHVMYFYNDKIPKSRGFSIHGTYWHSSFGAPMSQGDIDLKPEDASQLYFWAQPDLKGQKTVFASTDNPGTQINISGETL